MSKESFLQSSFSAGAASDYPTGLGKPLTEGEAALVRSIFGDEIDTQKVRKHLSLRRHPTAAAGTFNARTIQFYGSTYEKDFSQTKNIFNYGVFVHEMTHVLQYAHPLRKVFHDIRHPTLRHDYQLTAQSRFKDFGTEQQGYIVEDYARIFLFPDRYRRPPHITEYLPVMAPNFEKSSLQSIALLKKVVEDRFPEARKTRLKLEAEDALRQKAAPPAPPRVA